MVQRPQTPSSTPPPLTTAASLVAVEGLVLVALAVLELASLHGERLSMGLSTAVFFLAAGAGLVACGWALWSARRWGQGPALVAQLVTLGLAWNLRAGSTTVVAVGLAVLALVVIAGILHPASREALESEDAVT